MRFKLYWMATWVKEILEQHQDFSAPEEVQQAMEKVLDFVTKEFSGQAGKTPEGRT